MQHPKKDRIFAERMNSKRQSVFEEALVWRTNLEREEREIEARLRGARLPRVIVTGFSPAPEYPLEKRGVYVSRFLTLKGRRFLYCVDRRGREVARVIVRGPGDWSAAEEAAVGILDELDPLPKLLE